MVFFNAPKNSDTRTERLLALLQFVANNELLTHHLYSDFLKHSQHISSDISNLCRSALNEDQDHFDAIRTCINRLRGRVSEHKLLTNPGLPTFDEHLDTNNLLDRLRATEAFSVQAYNEICAISMEYDYQVFDLSYRNMNENIAHLDFVSNLLNNLHNGHDYCGRGLL